MELALSPRVESRPCLRPFLSRHLKGGRYIVKLTRVLVVITVAASLCACSFENKYEKEADNITRAVMNNDLTPVKGDIAPRVNITRVQIAQAADELNAQGKLVSVKETTTNC